MLREVYEGLADAGEESCPCVDVQSLVLFAEGGKSQNQQCDTGGGVNKTSKQGEG